MPPLRERLEDLPLLAEHFLEKLRRATGRELRLGHDALRAMMRYRWPGNVRELKNALEYAAIVCEGTTIHATDLPPGLREPWLEQPVPAELTSEPLRLRAALEACNWEITRCAKLLGMNRTTLWRKMKRYGIRRL